MWLHIRKDDLREAGDWQDHYIARGYLSSSICRVRSTVQRLPLLKPGHILQNPRRNLSEVVRRNGMLRRHGHCPIGSLQRIRVTHPPGNHLYTGSCRLRFLRYVNCVGLIPLNGFPIT